MPRHALRGELAAKLSDGWTGSGGRHVLGSEMPSGSGLRHALAAEVDAIVTGPAETVPTFHGTATNKGFTASSPVGPVTGTRVGDVMVAFTSGNAFTATITPPAGWTLIGDLGGVEVARLRVYTKVATAINEDGGTWAWPGGSHNHVVTVLAYGAAKAPTVAGTSRAATGDTLAAPSATSLAAGAVLVVYAYFATNGTAPAWPGTMTVRSPNSGASATGLGADEPRPTPGATGTRLFTLGGAATNISAASLILEPA